MNLLDVKKFRLVLCAAFILMFSSLAFLFARLRKFNTLASTSQVYASRFQQHSKVRGSTSKSVGSAVAAKLDQMRRYLDATGSAMSTPYPAERVGRYLMLNPELCSGVEQLDIIIVVHTAPGHFGRRQKIRETFGRESLFLPFRVRVAFMLGRPRDERLHRLLRLEYATRNDTVMADFIDDYRNLTLKGVLGYRWVSQHCRNSRLMLKIDDDVMVNMYKLLYSFLTHTEGKKKSIFCNVWDKDSIPIYREGKWAVDQRVFPGLHSFPYDYCSGFLVLMTTDLIGPMFDAAMTAPFFWIDDVYLFGMLPSVVGGVTYYKYGVGKYLTFSEEMAIGCLRNWKLNCPIFASLTTEERFWYYWNLISRLFTTSSWRVESKVVQR